MNWIAETLGYIAISAGFFAATKKDMGTFRIWHLISNIFYVVYAVFLESIPLLIASAVFCVIHSYHLRKLRLEKVRAGKGQLPTGQV